MEDIAYDIEGRIKSDGTVTGLKKAKNRAKLIARDQVGKAYGELNKVRQEELGISRYVFRTSMDERVRANHKAMNGKLCAWHDASIYYDRQTGKALQRSSIGGVEKHPGADYQCRCGAEAYIQDLL